jgi:trk system potassium uptake protein TrkA
MKIIIIGCGRVGAGLAKVLNMRGHSVTVVDSDPQAFERLGKNFKGQTVVGLSFDQQVLIKAGIEKADALAAVTASDEANVVAARIAKQVFRVPCVAARAYDPRKAEIYRRFGLQTISPVALGIDRMVELLTFSQITLGEKMGTGEVDRVTVEIQDRLVSRTVADLTVQGEINVVAITRDGKTFLPVPATTFNRGDIVHLVVLVSSLDRLREMLG